MKQKFIRTTDESTAITLSNLGFQRVDELNDIYIFLNTDNLKFSNDVDKSKIKYTNILYI